MFYVRISFVFIVVCAVRDFIDVRIMWYGSLIDTTDISNDSDEVSEDVQSDTFKDVLMASFSVWPPFILLLLLISSFSPLVKRSANRAK